MNREPPPTDPNSATAHRAVVASVLATTSSVLPGFLTGATSVQLRNELDFGETELGLAIGAFFLGSALGSAQAGRLGERIGPRAAVRLGLGITALTQLAIGVGADRWGVLVGLLVVAGLANSLTQTAVNLLLTRAVASTRMGLAVAIKQAGMPAATGLGGLAVPTLALTVGWEWAYLAGGALAVVAAGLVGRVDARSMETPADVSGRPDTARRSLLVAAGGIALGAAAAGATSSFIVASTEAAGVDPGLAGLTLAFGSVVGIVARLVVGARADRSGRPPLRTASTMLLAGSLGLLALATGETWLIPIGTLVGFAFGWAWPGLFNLAVIRANPSGPAAATGITQTGTYIGAVVGPIGAGLLVDLSGYAAAWSAAAGCAIAAGVVMRFADRALHAPSAAGRIVATAGE